MLNLTLSYKCMSTLLYSGAPNDILGRFCKINYQAAWMVLDYWLLFIKYDWINGLTIGCYLLSDIMTVNKWLGAASTLQRVPCVWWFILQPGTVELPSESLGHGGSLAGGWLASWFQLAPQCDLGPWYQPSATWHTLGCDVNVSQFIQSYGVMVTSYSALMTIFLFCRVQEFFLKRANQAKKLAASSHLVVNAAEGSKYNACKKWKLPAVTKQ